MSCFSSLFCMLSLSFCLVSVCSAEYGKQEDEAAKLKEEADARMKDMEDSMATHSGEDKDSLLASSLQKEIQYLFRLI